jgi:hypothetical protein
MVNMYHPELSKIDGWAKRFIDSSSEPEKYRPSFIGQTKWKLFFLADNVRELEGAGIPQLRFERKKIARLSGGLRFFGSGNKYLRNALPHLIFETIYSIRLTIGTTQVDITETTKAFDLTDFLSMGQNSIELAEIVPVGVTPESLKIELSLHEHAEWAPQGSGHWRNEKAELKNPASDVMLIGCRKGEMLHVDYCDDLSATWSLHASVAFSKLAIPCVNLTACEKRIEKQISDLFLQQNRLKPSLNTQLLWLRTLREAKPHPLIMRRRESAKIWESLQDALNKKVKIT